MWPGCLSQAFLFFQFSTNFLFHPFPKILAFFSSHSSFRVFRRLLFHIFKPCSSTTTVSIFYSVLLNPGLCLWVLENMTATETVASHDDPWLRTQHSLNQGFTTQIFSGCTWAHVLCLVCTHFTLCLKRRKCERQRIIKNFSSFILVALIWPTLSNVLWNPQKCKIFFFFNLQSICSITSSCLAGERGNASWSLADSFWLAMCSSEEAVTAGMLSMAWSPCFYLVSIIFISWHAGEVSVNL